MALPRRSKNGWEHSAAALLLLTSPLLGCEILESTSASVILAGAMTERPELRVPRHFEVPHETGATVFVGEDTGATDGPTPIAHATVRVTYAGNVVQLEESLDTPGTYAASSASAPGLLLYAEGAIYSFEATLPSSDDAVFGGTVEAPAVLSAAALVLAPMPASSLPGATDVLVHPKATALALRWSPQYGRHAFVTVLKSNPNAPGLPEIVYDTRPQTPNELVDLIVGVPPESLTVPAETFEQNGIYAVVLTVMEKGIPKTNTFVGSPFLAGSAAAIFLAVGVSSL